MAKKPQDNRIQVKFESGHGMVLPELIVTITKDSDNSNTGLLYLKAVKKPVKILSNIDGVISKWMTWKSKQAKAA